MLMVDSDQARASRVGGHPQLYLKMEDCLQTDKNNRKRRSDRIVGAGYWLSVDIAYGISELDFKF